MQKEIVKLKEKRESRNGKYKDYSGFLDSEREYYFELTRKSKAFETCTPRQRLFVINYVLTGGNASKACSMSGCETRYYAQQAGKWMKEDKIILAIKEFWEIVFGDKISKIERNLIDHLYRRAFTNRWQYFNKDGTLKDSIKTLEDLGEDHCIVDGIEKKFYGKDADVAVTVYKLADRDSAYKQLQNMLGIGSKNINVSTSIQEQTSGVLVVPEVLPADKWEEIKQ